MFLIPMSLVIFCLLFSFVDYVPVKGVIIWYLSLTVWHIVVCELVPFISVLEYPPVSPISLCNLSQHFIKLSATSIT